MDEPTVFVRVYDVAKELHTLATRWPKVHRPTLTRRILDRSLDLLTTVTELRYEKRRELLFRTADRHLDALRVLLRLAHDLRVVSTKQYERLVHELNVAGQMLGGWKKAS